MPERFGLELLECPEYYRCLLTQQACEARKNLARKLLSKNRISLSLGDIGSAEKLRRMKKCLDCEVPEFIITKNDEEAVNTETPSSMRCLNET